MWKDPLTMEAVEQNLKDAGCPKRFIQTFLEQYPGSTPAQQLQLLHAQRSRILEQLHDCQKHLDCMDYLCYQIRRQGSEP